MSERRLEPITLRNPGRLIVPLATAVLVVLMFAPPILLADVSRDDPIKIGAGISLLLVCTLWLARSAWKAPFEITIDGGLTVRRLLRVQQYELARVRRWFFSVPDGPPTTAAPGSNALLTIILDDRTRFRGEVTAEEAERLVQILPPAVR